MLTLPALTQKKPPCYSTASKVRVSYKANDTMKGNCTVQFLIDDSNLRYENKLLYQLKEAGKKTTSAFP